MFYVIYPDKVGQSAQVMVVPGMRSDIVEVSLHLVGSNLVD